VIRVGNLDARRDFTDVRDVVRGYWLRWRRGGGEVYNICSGRDWTIRAMLDLLSADEGKGEGGAGPGSHAALRRSGPARDAGKFQKATGWKPTIPFETTLRDLLEYWRAR